MFIELICKQHFLDPSVGYLDDNPAGSTDKKKIFSRVLFYIAKNGYIISVSNNI
jgi:hypothetical protein